MDFSQEQRLFGIIGYPLGHSFSKGYFTEKFEKLGIAATHRYEKFEIPDMAALPVVLAQNPTLCGFNVTIPHKQAILPLLDNLDASAQKVGAVNVVKIESGKMIGYNSDYYGFKSSLARWLGTQPSALAALVLGNGGAAKAVQAALTDLGIAWQGVSRQASATHLSYADLNAELLATHRLIVNTSPLGTFPNLAECPAIPYQYLGAEHWLYDLVYNPAQTLFMQKGAAQGAQVCNGLEMLHLQAEKAWEIWNA
jgi:shikimate dehydrogenase